MNTLKTEIYRVKSLGRVDLSSLNPADDSAFGGKKGDAEDLLGYFTEQLGKLQELLYAGHKHKLLVVLQSMDTGGKDGTIKNVFREVNPQGIRIANFKVPTLNELDHDYLWRIHAETPAKGEVVIFNRSHYEDVVTVRVHDLIKKDQAGMRYKHIRDFEQMLAEEGTTILKFYLHIDKDEQKKRLEKRLADSSKHWKFNLQDLEERKLWGEYMKAYAETLSHTSTDYAPWYTVPANRKWYRNLIIASVMVEKLKDLNMKYPPLKSELKDLVIK